jgi:transcription-repair coupling factor (superfamily II helicase)
MIFWKFRRNKCRELETNNTIVLPLYQGFIDEENQITCYTDHQIFERYHKFNIKQLFEKQNIT